MRRGWFSTGLLLLVMAGAPARAYNLDLRTDNSLVSEDTLHQMVISAGRGTQNDIPDTKWVYVHVLTRAKSRLTDPGQYVFYHRIELRRHFKSTDPYTYNGWLPIHREEVYGVDNAKGVRQSLNITLRRFFEDVKNLKVR